MLCTRCHDRVAPCLFCVEFATEPTYALRCLACLRAETSSWDHLIDLDLHRTMSNHSVEYQAWLDAEIAKEEEGNVNT